jgi:uncharacterized RDD family membrane protein YckC
MTILSRKQSNPPTFIGHYAGFVTRLMAFVIDILVVTLSISLIWAVLALLIRFFSVPLFALGFSLLVGVFSLISSLFNVEGEALATNIIEAGDTLRLLALFFTGFGFTFFTSLVYNIFFWMLAGKTLGKAVMGIRVIGPRGARVTFWCALRRSVGYWISALPFFLGFLWVLITEERTGWHDKLAGTRVIYDYEARYNAAMVGRLTRLATKLETKRNQKNGQMSSDSNAS